MSSEAKKIDALRSTVESLQVKLKEKEVEIRRLTVRNSLDKDSQRVGHLEKKLERAKGEHDLLEQEVCSLKQERGSLEYEVDLLRNLVDLESAADEHVAAADSFARCKVLESDVALLTSRLRATESEVHQRRESEVDARKLVDEASEDQRRLVAQVSELSSRLKEFEDESSRCRSEADHLAAERDEASDLMLVMEETIFDLETRVSELKKEVDHFKNKAATAEKECSGARLSWSEGDRELNTLKERVATLEAERSQLSSSKESASKNEHSLRAELDASHRALEQLQSDNMDLQETISKMKVTVNHSKELEVDNDDLHSAMTRLQQELVQQRSAEDEVVNRCNLLEDRVETLQGTIKSMKNRYEDNIEELEESQTNLAKRCEELGHECADKEAQLDRISQDLKRAVERLANASVVGGFTSSSLDTTSIVSGSPHNHQQSGHHLLSSTRPTRQSPFSAGRNSNNSPSPAHVDFSPSPSQQGIHAMGGNTSVGSSSTRSKAAAAKIALLLNTIGDYSPSLSSHAGGNNLSSYSEGCESGSRSNGRCYSSSVPPQPSTPGTRVAVSLDVDTSRGFDEPFPHQHRHNTSTTSSNSRFREVGGRGGSMMMSPPTRIGLNDAPSSLRISPMTPSHH